MDSKLQARLEKIENRLNAIWDKCMNKTIITGSVCEGTVESFQLNKWYKSTNPKSRYLAFIKSGLEGGRNNGYGFDFFGTWRDDPKCVWSANGCVLASEEEVKEALIKESEERYGNIKLGMHFKGHWGEVIQTINTISDYYLIDKGSVFGVNGMALMIDGNWAEIIRYTVKKGETYYHNIYHNLKAIAIENTEKERFEAVVISEDKNCASEAFKIDKITECWLNEWTKVDNI